LLRRRVIREIVRLPIEISHQAASFAIDEEKMSSKGWVKVGENPDRRDSFDSFLLQAVVDNAVLDSIEFDEATMDKANGVKSSESKPPAYSPTSEPPVKTPSCVQNIILASRALRKINLNKSAFTLRRQAYSFGPFSTKLEFAKVFVDLRLQEASDIEPGLQNNLSDTEACMDYALAKVKEAIEELEKLRFGKDERVAKIKACFPEFRGSKTSKEQAD
jgi:hypothetical protein